MSSGPRPAPSDSNEAAKGARPAVRQGHCGLFRAKHARKRGLPPWPKGLPLPEMKAPARAPRREGTRGGGRGRTACLRGTIWAQQARAHHEHRAPLLARQPKREFGKHSFTTASGGQRCLVTSQGAGGSVPETRKRGCETEGGNERASRSHGHGHSRRLNVKTATPSSGYRLYSIPTGVPWPAPRNGKANPQVPVKPRPRGVKPY